MEDLKSKDPTKSAEIPSPSEAINLLRLQAREIQQQFAGYLTIKVAQLKYRVTKIVTLAVLIIFGFIAVASVIVTSVAIVVQGLAVGVSAVFPSYPWIGDVSVGLGLLCILTGVVLMLKRKVMAVQIQAAATRVKRKHSLDHQSKSA